MKAKLFAIGILFVLCACFLVVIYNVADEKATIVTIAIPRNDKVENYNTNYYTEWLEERTGYDIRFEYIPAGYEKEYIHTMLTSGNSEIDGVFLSGNEDYISVEELNAYGGKGFVADLSEYISKDCNFYKILEEYKKYGLYQKMESDGAVYYYPNMDTARKSRNLQVFWINSDWLGKLDMSVPKTSEELREVLLAFRDRDPNGNGKQDELPLISCEDNESLQSYNYLINAFAYNDSLHCRLYGGKDGSISCAACEDSFRNGLAYCNRLYEDGLLTDNCFYYSPKQMMELVNSPDDLVGAFTCKSIVDVIYPNFPDILSKFIYVPPLGDGHGNKYAVWVDYLPRIGGYVPAGSRHVAEVCDIMDNMLSEEGSLISQFGEKGTDWTDSRKSDLSIYGNRAYITTVNYLGDKTQNKNYAGTGPQVLMEKYANGVTWNGDNSLFEYHDVRAVKLYENYYLPEGRQIEYSDYNYEKYRKLQSYEDEMLRYFITGEYDVDDDAAWNMFTDNINDMLKEIDEKVVEE